MNELMRRLLFLPPEASTAARSVDRLHFFVITVTMIGAATVGIMCAYYLIRYRRRTRAGRAAADGPTSRGLSTAAELIMAGSLFALFFMWWVIGFRQYVKIRTPPEDATQIYVAAKQWMWNFAYPDGTGSNGVLYVPAGRPVKLVMTSRDVIHSFFVPDFRIKQDVVPGRMTVMWFEADEPGEHQVLCTEYCGAGHSRMRARIVVLSAAEWERRALGKPPGEGKGGSTLAERGAKVAADRGCLRCHTSDGAPHIGPTWARDFGSTIETTAGERLEVDEAYLTQSMMDPLAKVRRGFQPVMPTYQGVLTAAEVGALVEYIRSLADVPVDTPEVPTPRPGVIQLGPGRDAGGGTP